nr:protein LAZ1-like isoform X1 [Ipomoea batatas]GMD38431.1 protein LAZ1-like isoform X1 [Ipomoea batatas]
MRWTTSLLSSSFEHWASDWVGQSLLSSYSTPIWATLIGGFFTLLSLALSIYLLLEHLSAYKNPEEQKFLIGVILMVPCYAIESFVSLLNPSISVYIEILRDGYESFAMYCFGRYLVACLGGEERTLEFMEREGRIGSKVPLLDDGHERGIINHPFPMNYILKPWKLDRGVYEVIKFGIVQYMIIKAFTAIAAVILQAFNVYCEGEFKWNCGYPYLAVVLNFTQSWALYCLVQFYTITKNELSHINPLYKFLTFKSIVFLTWWQGVAIALFCSLGIFKSPIAQALQFESSIQDFIICIEMGIASVVHMYVFPAKPYELMGERFAGAVSVLGDYLSADCPIDPEELRDSERPTKLRLPHPSIDDSNKTAIRESARDVFIGAGEYIVNDVKFTVNQAVEPMEKGFTKFNQKLHKISQNMKHAKNKRAKDDSSMATSSQTQRVIRGIDDPLLNGSFSDSGTPSRKKKQRRKTGYTSESGGESSSDCTSGGFQIRGRRWVTKD